MIFVLTNQQKRERNRERERQRERETKKERETEKERGRHRRREIGLLAWVFSEFLNTYLIFAWFFEGYLLKHM